MNQVSGGDYNAIGSREASVLENLNVTQHDTILGIECGTGHLGFVLKENHQGKYMGPDVLIEMQKYADRMIQRGDC